MTTPVERYLAEAHATETALITTLQAHITMTPEGSYRQLLERHLAETRRHAGAIERRLASADLGSNPIAAAVGVVETIVGQGLALAKGPLDLLRGASREEKLLKNAKDECATEALEIATYDALEPRRSACSPRCARRSRGWQRR
jgi:ferritin-like metal-binding protein YciE